MIRRRYTIRRDTREKRGLIFPHWLPILRSPLIGDTQTCELALVEETLTTGDYALAGYEHVCLLERKGSLRELHSYCFDHRDQLRSQLERLSEACRHPMILLEGDVQRYASKDHRALDVLHRLLCEYHIAPPLFLRANNANQRREVGAYVARLFINYTESYHV